MSEDKFDTAPLAGRFSELERSLIEQFIRMQGYGPGAIAALPPEERLHLLKEAWIYASCKLGEVEARSHYIDGIHHTTADSFKAGE